MGNLPPIPERATKIPKVRSHANPNRDTSGRPIEETVSLDTVEEMLTFPGDLREPLDEGFDLEVSETLDLSEEKNTRAETDAHHPITDEEPDGSETS